MDKITWVYKNCKFAQLGQQQVMDFDEPNTFTSDPKQLNSPEFHKDIQNTGVEEQDNEFVGGFYHVTTNLPAVLHWGALKSRKQLGDQVQGLGGGFANEAPTKISLTYNSQKAHVLFDALQFAAMVANNQVSASQIMDHVVDRYGTEIQPESNAIGVFKWFGVPKKILRDEYLTGLEEMLDKQITTGEQKYEFMQQLDDALGKDESDMDTGGDYSAPNRVGFTAPFEVFSKINPQNIGILQLEVRKDAQPEHVQQELELRFDTDDVRLALNPVVNQ